jgi:hypothetical protein
VNSSQPGLVRISVPSGPRSQLVVMTFGPGDAPRGRARWVPGCLLNGRAADHTVRGRAHEGHGAGRPGVVTKAGVPVPPAVIITPLACLETMDLGGGPSPWSRPAFALELVDAGITSASVNTDGVLAPRRFPVEAAGAARQ